MIDAVVFDLDGLLLDTEQVWDEVREGLVRERGGQWHDRAQADMMGMSSTEWSRYLHEELGLAEPPEELNRIVVERMEERYRGNSRSSTAPSRRCGGSLSAGRSGLRRRPTAR